MYSKVTLRVTKSLGYGNTRTMGYPTVVVPFRDSLEASKHAYAIYVESDEYKAHGNQVKLSVVGVEGCPREEWPPETQADLDALKAEIDAGKKRIAKIEETLKQADVKVEVVGVEAQGFGGLIPQSKAEVVPAAKNSRKTAK